MSDDINKDDPFAEFEDWLVDGPAGEWPFEAENDLTERQRNLVQANVELLLDTKAWSAKMKRFEDCLSGIDNNLDRKVKIKLYCIHFDYSIFDDFTVQIRISACPINISFRYTVFVNCHFSFYTTNFSCSFIDFFGSSVSGGSLVFDDCEFSCHRLIFDHVKFNHTNFFWLNCVFGESGPESTSGEFINTHFLMHGSEFLKGGMRLGSCQFSNGYLSCSDCFF